MNYNEMTDFEINKAVAAACLGEWYDNGTCVIKCDDDDRSIFQPSNSWADAGPIIEKNRISIEFDGDDAAQWCHTISCEGLYGIEYQSNPLRAAMITFLLMQEAANE
ncbi:MULTISPECIES: phage protein NinX family protein [unclassified Pantoea]|uniref:phage protein NinX family protein n=1 Tax=unclassified Pantoea TaxID=2630326 RepID=UPI002269B2BE|nr:MULTISPECIES: phage protein NinX family protein [unclassified Pantoea]